MRQSGIAAVQTDIYDWTKLPRICVQYLAISLNVLRWEGHMLIRLMLLSDNGSRASLPITKIRYWCCGIRRYQICLSSIWWKPLRLAAIVAHRIQHNSWEYDLREIIPLKHSFLRWLSCFTSPSSTYQYYPSDEVYYHEWLPSEVVNHLQFKHFSSLVQPLTNRLPRSFRHGMLRRSKNLSRWSQVELFGQEILKNLSILIYSRTAKPKWFTIYSACTGFIG